ncbi:FAD/NAD(P)-binding protein [Streptomyces decoyicus]|uniref:FAD/NAD(P)-binding protein n=1 Tax=Streptomyces decoyicus TaxID=249567 RepID=UPI003868F773
MATDTTARDVAVIGAGAAGTLTTARLMQRARARDLRLNVWLIDPTDDTGKGRAYRTQDPRHLLNVPARRMSAFAEDQEHFVRWLEAQARGPIDRDAYVPRMWYGEYLDDVLRTVAASAPTARLHRLTDKIVDVHSRGSELILTCLSGRKVAVDAAVLALGASGPGCTWVPSSLCASPHFVADPWAPGALSAVPSDGDVLAVGSGLTMADVAVTLSHPGRVMHVVSRHGFAPQHHTKQPATPPEAPEMTGEVGLDSLRRSVLRHISASRRLYGDWRVGVDSLRPVTAMLWRQLSPADRERFFREDVRLWDVHRHRMPPETAEAVRQFIRTGRLRITAGRLTDAVITGKTVQAQLEDGHRLNVSAVVNCTGIPAYLGSADDPLLHRLLSSGLARRHHTGIGLDTFDDGRLRSARHHHPAIWTLGALMRGALLESTAIAEIREQADNVASSMLDALWAVHTIRRPSDPFGLCLSTSKRVAAIYNAALNRLLQGGGGVSRLLSQAVSDDPDFAMGHAALAVLSHERGDVIAVRDALARAKRSAIKKGDERERGFVAAVTERITASETDGGASAGGATLLRHIRNHPRDALAVHIAVPTIAFDGVTSGSTAWQLIEGLAPVYGDHWWYLGQLAFVRQEQERWEEAESLAARALSAEPSAGHAAHARAHVFYETGAHAAGLRWLDGWIDRHRPTADHRSHFSWHAALHELMLDDPQAVRSRYLRQLAPPHVRGGRALVDSASLLWRCRVTGRWQGPLPAHSLLEAAPPRWLTHPPTPFVAMHSALAASTACDLGVLDRLRLDALRRSEIVFHEVVVPLCDGLSAVVTSQWERAARLLNQLLPKLGGFGGSAAQRDVIEETLLYTLIAGGRHREAAHILAARLERRPARLDYNRLRVLPSADLY